MHFFLYFILLGMGPRALCMLGELFVTGIAIYQLHMVHILKYTDRIKSRPFTHFWSHLYFDPCHRIGFLFYDVKDLPDLIGIFWEDPFFSICGLCGKTDTILFHFSITVEAFITKVDISTVEILTKIKLKLLIFHVSRKFLQINEDPKKWKNLFCCFFVPGTMKQIIVKNIIG